MSVLLVYSFNCTLNKIRLHLIPNHSLACSFHFTYLSEHCLDSVLLKRNTLALLCNAAILEINVEHL